MNWAALAFVALGGLVALKGKKQPRPGDPEYVGPPAPATLSRNEAAVVRRVLPYRDQIEDAIARRAPLSTALVMAVIAQESSGRAEARNTGGGGRGAWGLMQVRTPALTDYNRATGLNLVLEQLLEPSAAIEVGTWYLHQSRIEFGSETDAVRAYYAGPTGARQNADAGADYASKVLAWKETFRRVLAGEVGV